MDFLVFLLVIAVLTLFSLLLFIDNRKVRNQLSNMSEGNLNLMRESEEHKMKSIQLEAANQSVRELLENEKRLDKIGEIITALSAQGNTLVLVDRVAAGIALAERIEDSVFVTGNTKSKDRKTEYDEVATATNKVIIATYGIAAVGLNIPRIFNLVLIEPGKSFVRVIQSIGRGIRKAEDKDSVEIYDITSSSKFSKRHLTTRKAFYKDANYPFSVEKLEYK
jgi:superfamily II DNA or RNA helicase